jgi:hypothetical protein
MADVQLEKELVQSVMTEGKLNTSRYAIFDVRTKVGQNEKHVLSYFCPTH